MQPMFLPGPSGRLHVVLHAPAEGAPSGAVLFVPPFGDEMNRSRRMVAETARAMACIKLEVLLMDPFGTGDSEGDYGQATWSRWCASGPGPTTSSSDSPPMSRSGPTAYVPPATASAMRSLTSWIALAGSEFIGHCARTQKTLTGGATVAQSGICTCRAR